MISRSNFLPGLVVFAVLCGGMAPGMESQAVEILIDDGFSGNANDPIDSSVWKVPPGGDGASFGQTTMKTDVTSLSTIAIDIDANDDRAAVLELDTFLPGNTVGNPDNRAFGAEFQSKSSYAIGGGLIWEARVKFGSTRDTGTAGTPGVIAPPPSGFVGGAFLYDVSNNFNVAGDPLVRDEIDFELLSKEPTQILTNTYNDIGFEGVGSEGNPSLIANPVPSYSPYNFHDYKMTVTPTGTPGVNRTKWFVDGTEILSVTDSTSADDAMTAHFNLWMPDGTFPLAEDGNLSAEAALDNEIYTMSVDSVMLTRLNTSRDATNLVPNGGFASLAGWYAFNNADISSEQGDSGDGDGFALKTFAQFVTPDPATFDASGVWRVVPVTANDQLSLTLDVLSPSGDSTVGTGIQFAEATVRFRNAGGQVLSQRTGIPLNNGDPNLNEDIWQSIFVEGTAPAGTTSAIVQFNHISNNSGIGSGSIFWDNIQLNVLNIDLPSGDFNGDFVVDGADFLFWQRNLGDATNLGLWQAGYGAGALAGAVSAVPEPSTIMLVVASMMSLGFSRRKFRS